MTSSRTRALAGLIVATVVAATLALSSPAPAAPVTSTVPRSQKVFMVSDSVGLGAKSTLPTVFPPGWEITVTGEPGKFVGQLAATYVAPRAASTFGDHAVVAAGYNYQYWDPPRFAREVDTMINTLRSKGVKHIYWVTMRENIQTWAPSAYNSVSQAYKTLYSYYPTANQQLRDAQQRHPELSIVDWAAVANQFGLTYDTIHLNPEGARQYSTLIAATIGTTVTRLPAGNITVIDVDAVPGVPAETVAAALSITAMNPRNAGYVTAYPCGAPIPNVSNLNVRSARTVAVSTIVPLGVDGTVCIYQHMASNLIIDLTAVLTPDSGFVPLVPARALDTRPGLSSTTTDLVVPVTSAPGVPADTQAVVLNLTTIGASQVGELRLFTCGTDPSAIPTRTLNVGMVQNLLVIAQPDASGNVCIRTTRSVVVIVDVLGAFEAGADVHPISTARLHDSRWTTSALMPASSVFVHQVEGFSGIPAEATAAVMTVSLLKPSGIGFGAAYPCANPAQGTSMMNVLPNEDLMASAVVALDWAGWACVLSSRAAQVAIDVSAWMGAGFVAIQPVRLVDSRITS